MGKNKLKRFAENKRFSHVVEPLKEEILQGLSLAGYWNRDVFKNNNPITLELGCGKGEYTVAMARAFPDRNFIGVDIKGARIWRGAKTVEEEKLSNAAFLRLPIQWIEKAFAPQEISEIWITFPDPQIKYRRSKHRLTHPDYIKKYTLLLQEKGLIHLKTDSEFLHGYTQGLIALLGLEVKDAYYDIDEQMQDRAHLVHTVQTHYEQIFRSKGKAISYLSFYS